MVTTDLAARTPIVQGVWHTWESQMRADVVRDPATARTGLAARVDEMLATRRRLLDRLGSGD